VKKQIDSATYIRLRLLVGYLGEKSQNGWWATDFLSPVAKAFLEPSFPRTWRIAQYSGVTEAARRVHDEHIGVGNVFHLFRLPAEIEQQLHKQLHMHLLANAGDKSIFAAPNNPDLALKTLEELAGEAHLPAEGPLHVGKLSHIRDLHVLRGIARHYHDAFRAGHRVFPYFVGIE